MFRAEQQALAMMNHENIARVFDAGALVAGITGLSVGLLEAAKARETSLKN